MNNLYYITSGSTNLVIIVPEGSQNESARYSNSSLEITASAYDTSGSYSSTIGTLRAYIRSGSTTYASFPLETVNIFYNIYPDYNEEVSTFPTPQEQSASFTSIISFFPDAFSPSVSNSFSLYNLTKTTTVFTASTYPFENYTSLLIGDTYIISLSGSGGFYTSSITIIDESNNTYIAQISGTNQNISASFSNTGTDKYNINLITNILPYISMSFTGSMPVTPTSSLNAWNTFFQTTGSSPSFSASYLQNSSTSVILAGGNLGTITGSILLTNIGLTNYYSYGINNITSLSLSGNNNLVNSLSIANSPSLLYYDISQCSIKDSLPILTSSIFIRSFLANDNDFSGSISNYNLGNLEYFDVSGNYLTGSTTNLSQSFNIYYYDVANNKLSGSISSVTNAYNLRTFACDNNYLTGSIPNFNTNFILDYVSVRNNQLDRYISGSVSSTLLHFDAFNNKLSQSSVDGILRDLSQASGSNGYVDLQGGTNITPSATGLTYATILTNRGWNIKVN
jgi:hypothetical protein